MQRVIVESRLLPIEGEIIEGTTADRAAPHISSRGVWSTFERTFYDPNTSSYQSLSSESLYSRHESEKIRKYNTQDITIEKCLFTPPLVWNTTNGKEGREMKTIGMWSTRVQFAILGSVLISLGVNKENPMLLVPFCLWPSIWFQKPWAMKVFRCF